MSFRFSFYVPANIQDKRAYLPRCWSQNILNLISASTASTDFVETGCDGLCFLAPKVIIVALICFYPIVVNSVDGLKAIFREGYQYKKAGVIVMGLTPQNEKQLNMFTKENPKHEALMKVMDKMNHSIGQKKLK